MDASLVEEAYVSSSSNMMDFKLNEKMKNVRTIFGLMLMMVIFFQSGLSFGGTNQGQSEEQKRFSGSLTQFNRSSLITSQGIAVDESNPKSPSEVKAFFLSFILPGAGEYYAGSKSMAKIFFSSEVLLWTTYFSFRMYGHWKKDDYQQMAVSHAGVNVSGKDHRYFVNIENYDNIREYNKAKLRQRQFDELYPENGYYDWQWDSETSRYQYEKLRIASDKAYNRSLFVIGGILANHIVSAIDALRIAKKSQKESENSYHIGLTGLPEGGMMVLFWKSF